jgi:RHS repeat-associated protein
LQVEGSFERFFWRSENNRWIVQQRGGNVLEFGNPITRPDLQPVGAFDTDATSARTFRWYLASEHDLHGAHNVIIYQWAADGPSSRKYLRHIYYLPPDSGLATAAVDAFAYHVELRWDNPPFRQSDVTFADKRPHYKRLRRVAISSKPWSGGGDRELVRSYNLAYYPERGEPVVAGEAPLWGRSALKSVQMEGRCLVTVRETGGMLPDPTSCPMLPPTTFEYSTAKLSFGAVSYSPVGTPATTKELAFPTSSALIDVNRDGLPDLIQAWPTNFRRSGFTAEYNDCRSGDFIINPTDEQTNDPQLTCAPDDKTDDNVNIRPARIHKLWMNHGPSAAKVNFDFYCLDAGDLQPQSPTYYQVSSPSGYSARKPALFTQYAAEAVSEWGNGALLWSLAGYHAFGFQPAHIRKTGDSFQPDEYDIATFQHFCPERISNPPQLAYRWFKTGSLSWSKDPDNKDLPEFHHFNIVDIDGDGYGDLLTETVTPGVSGNFERAAIRYTRKVSAQEKFNGIAGPALHPFVIGDGQASTIQPRSTWYSTYADINGDGVLDLVTAVPTEHGGIPEVRLGNGRGGFGCDPTDVACQIVGNGDWLGRAYLLALPAIRFVSDPSPLPLVNDFSYTNGRAHFFHDVTGDGLADLIEYDPPDSALPGRIRLWINVDGLNFRCANSTDCTVATFGNTSGGSPFVSATHRIVFADIDGNGTEDFVFINVQGIWTFSFLQAEVVPPVGPHANIPGLLTRVRNGVGADTEVVYQTIQELDSAANVADPNSFSHSWSTHVPTVLPIATRIGTRDTPSTAGSPLSQPYALNRTRRFEYRDPAYDLWQHRFMGFARSREIASSGEVAQRWFYFGACESGPFIDLKCINGSDGGNDGAGNSTYPDKPSVGAIVRLDRFLPAPGARPSQWLMTRTFQYGASPNWIQPAGLSPDRPVVWSRIARVDTFLYDTALPVSSANLIKEPWTAQPVPNQAGMVHLRVDFDYDSAGNFMSKRDYGKFDDGTQAALDDEIVLVYGPQHGRCSSDWSCLAQEVQTAYRPPALIEDQPLRDYKLIYGPNLDLIEITGRLFATSSVKAGLQRDLTFGVGAPATAQVAEGWKTIRTFEYDAYGNVRGILGELGSNQFCRRATYDLTFKQFPETIQRFAEGGCSGTMLRDDFAYDRGLGTVSTVSFPNDTLRRIETDAFGRPQKIYEPRPDSPSFSTFLATQFIRHDHEPVRWVEEINQVDKDQFVASISVLNGLGEPVLAFTQADSAVDGSPWVLRDWTERDDRGNTTSILRPWFFNGDAQSVADNATPVAQQGVRESTYRDAFGRPNMSLDGTLPTAIYRYSPLVVEVQDAEQLKATGLYKGLKTVVRLDGHNRVIQTTTPSASDRTTTKFEYLGTGEIAAIQRSSDSDPFVFGRQTFWDSFGRMIMSLEPNASKVDSHGAIRAWRYVYDNEGRMVGTSDARGCGENLFYDALGRTIALDFSPCNASQPNYTPPNLATGDGTEGFYQYDTYPAGSIVTTATFANHAQSAVGQLISVQDRGAYSLFSYDERGLVRRVMRQVVKTGLASFSLAGRYADHWFKQEADYDLAGRLKKRTLGLEGPSPFSPDSFEAYAYSARGLPREVDSSFGVLVRNLKYSALGLPMNLEYGDLAGTRLQMGYDERAFLRKWQLWRPSAPALWSAPSTPNYSKPDWSTTQLALTYLEFGYDDVGNILSINEASGAAWPVGAKSVSRSFRYDAAYRLSRVEYQNANDVDVGAFLHEAVSGDRHPVAERIGNRRVRRQSFKSDWQGNLVSSYDDQGLRFDRSLGAILNGVDHAGNHYGPNQLIDADGIHASYDPAGNLTSLSVSRANCWSRMPNCSHLFQYDWSETGELQRARRWDFASGPVPSVNTGTAPIWDLHYAYSEGRRMLTSVTGGGSTTNSLEPLSTLRIVNAPYSTSTSSYTIGPQNQVGYAGGVSRVFLDRAGVLPMAGSSRVHVYFNVGDYLGSSAFSIDKDSSEVTERASYQSYGGLDSDYRPKRWNFGREEFKFTGKQDDIETGTAYFGARYYSAHIGRFLSPDPLTLHGSMGDLNPYSYVSGRVTRVTDLLGLGVGILVPIPCAAGDGPGGCFEDIEDAPSKTPREARTGTFDPERSTRYFEPAPEDVPYTTIGDESSSAGGVPTVRHTVEARRQSNSERYAAAGYPEIARMIDAANREDTVLKYVVPTAMAAVTSLASGAALAVEEIVETEAPAAVTEVVDSAATSQATALTKFYPENYGFAGAPERNFLMPGQMIDRYGGSAYSRFFSPQGTPAWSRSLPPGAGDQALRTFEVLKPFEVESGTVAPWFNQLGGGVQYQTPVNLETLLSRGIIREVTP